jgi:hypothetical protein
MNKLVGGLTLLAALSLCGCSALTTKQVTKVPGPPETVATITTNTPAPEVVEYVSPVTGEATLTTNYPPPVVLTNYTTVRREFYITNYVANPQFVTAVEAVRDTNAFLNPTPTAPFVNIGAGLLTGLAGILAAYQNRRANKASGLLSTVVTAIETFEDPRVKREVAKVSAMRGNASELDKVVQSISAEVPELKMDANALLDYARTNKPIEDLPNRYKEAVTQLRTAVRSNS